MTISPNTAPASVAKQIRMYYNDIIWMYTHKKPTLRITPKKHIGATTVISLLLSMELLRDMEVAATESEAEQWQLLIANRVAAI